MDSYREQISIKRNCARIQRSSLGVGNLGHDAFRKIIGRHDEIATLSLVLRCALNNGTSGLNVIVLERNM